MVEFRLGRISVMLIAKLYYYIIDYDMMWIL